MNSYLTSMDTISLSCTIFELFDSKIFGFEFDLWRLKVIWGRKKLYYSKAHIWHHLSISYRFRYIRLQSAQGLTLTIELWRSSGIWYQKNLKAHIWLPIWLLRTPSLYLVPFSRYSTSKFLEFDLDLWPLKVIWGKKKYTIRKPIYDFLFDFYELHLSISYRSRDIRLQSF